MSSLDSESDVEFVPPRGFKPLEQPKFDAPKTLAGGKKVWLIKVPKSIIAKKQLPKRIPVPSRAAPEVTFKHERVKYVVAENKEEEAMARNVRILAPTAKKGQLRQLMVPISSVLQISEVASVPSINLNGKSK
ncbi:hypothetical protein BZA70DRAFT_294544 [Myxozyma melibiosi]|uniref:Uncharacterized protein n=1 Tax=Myxozyma melibiosi TaxID=54550 RepID=A0ABR1F8T7_9ASCO